jgi:hypothetical protein
MRVSNRAEELLATTSLQFVLNSLGDESTAVPFESVDSRYQLGG